MLAIRRPWPVTPMCRDQTFVAGLGERRDCSVGLEGALPLVGLDEVVELDQVDGVDPHPLERAFELRACGVAAAFAGLRGEEAARAGRGEIWRAGAASESP